jgi:ABC-type taurine transport system substrate-binding protein
MPKSPIIELVDDQGNPNFVMKTNAGSVAPGQSLKTFVGKVALSATVPVTVTLETVTAGKTLFITDIFLSHDTTAVIDTRIQANGVDIFRACVKGDTAPVQLSGIESQPSAAAGQVVTILYPITASPPNAYLNVYGFEQ